jgi:hypothetical protein
MMKWGINKLSCGLFIMAFLGILLLLSVQKLYSQTTGFKFYNNYSTRDYHRNATNLMKADDPAAGGNTGIVYRREIL